MNDLSPNTVAALLWIVIALIFIVFFYNFIRSILWWRASSRYVKEKMKIDDIVHVSTHTSRDNLGKVLEIRENEVDVIITVSKSSIYLPSK